MSFQLRIYRRTYDMLAESIGFFFSRAGTTSNHDSNYEIKIDLLQFFGSYSGGR